ncbi:MAG: epoxyqueuosine reductase QueH [Endomicrobiales bacterium]|nr:epoxyqueuosine reductase QueH [Endomicrobiales bacterium]
MKQKLLLHHCCAPCSPKVLESLRQEFEVVSFWFNPNIHPEEEYSKRKEAFEEFVQRKEIEVVWGEDFSMGEWLEKAGKLGDERCRFCYGLRLAQTAEAAKKLGIANFSTTLLSSPHQKHEMIKHIGADIAFGAGIEFVYRDFRPGYYAGKDEARKMGLYLQRYCGCMFSKQERESNKK